MSDNTITAPSVTQHLSRTLGQRLCVPTFTTNPYKENPDDP